LPSQPPSLVVHLPWLALLRPKVSDKTSGENHLAHLYIAPGPAYISSRSADVILSDIRPIKLNIEALRSINVFLDEILYSVLNAARSLTTHQLKSGLLKVLPTALGKEALLEAEMELRAYWERTAGSGASVAADDQGKDVNLQWSFEVSPVTDSDIPQILTRGEIALAPEVPGVLHA
jgi:hypothetical protein